MTNVLHAGFEHCCSFPSSTTSSDIFVDFIRQTLCPSNNLSVSDILENYTCPKCSSLPSTTWFSSEGALKDIVQFCCNDCRVIWSSCVVCDPCTASKDFIPILLYRRSKRQRMNIFKNQLSTHMLSCRSCTSESGRVGIAGNNATDAHVHEDHGESTEVDEVISTFESELEDMFPSDFDIRLKDNLKEAIYQSETTKSYAESLILKKWMQSKEALLHSTDVTLFLRILKLMNSSTRDGLFDLAFVIDELCQKQERECMSFRDTIRKLEQDLVHCKEKITDLEQQLEYFTGTNNSTTSTGAEETSDSAPIVLYDKIYLNVPMPRNVIDMRHILESKNGVLSACVIPTIHLHDSGCAYVLPSEALKISICMGMPFEHIWGNNYDEASLNSRSVYRSSVVKEKIRLSPVADDELTIALGYWSDGCICGTDSKGGRNSAKTITLHVPFPQMSFDHVFPLCFGRKNDDASLVMEIILNDLSSLTQTGMRCYVPALKKFVNVRYVFAYALQDRPEHAETTSFMSSGGTFSKRVGFSCPVIVKRPTSNTINGGGTEEITISDSQISCGKELASCSSCHGNRMTRFLEGHLQSSSTSNQRCADCYDWDMLAVKFKPTKDYPREMITGDNGLPLGDTQDDIGYVLSSKKVTFDSMKDACVVIFTKVLERKWTLKVVEQYARRECVRQHTWKCIYDHAVRIRNDDSDNRDVPPGLFPPFWKQDMIKLDHIHLGVMHYLFLNVGSHLITCIKQKLKGQQWKHVYDLWNTILADVRSMSLSWCKCWTLGSRDKPASVWVSENYVGFSIVCKTLSLSLRSLPQISNDMSLIEDACNAYYCLVSYVMSPMEPDNSTINAVSSLSKIFLTTIQRLDNSLFKDKDENKIETASCFVNLLSLSLKMKNFGVIRNFWEGGVAGEGIFLLLKGLVRRGLHHKGASRTLLRRMYQGRAIEHLVQSNEQQSYVSYVEANTSGDTEHVQEQNEHTFNAQRYRKFHAYSDISVVRQFVNDKRPLAVLYYSTTSDFYALMGHRKRKKKVLKLFFTDQTTYMNTKIFHIEVREGLMDLTELSNNPSDFLSCMAVPIYHKHNVIEQGQEVTIVLKKYYVVSEDHKECGRGLNFTFPSMHESIPHDIETNDNDSATNGSFSYGEQMFCRDRSQCRSLIGREVTPIEGSVKGVVKKFRYRQSISTHENALWTVQYYRSIDAARSSKNVEMTFIALKDVLLNELNIRDEQ